MRGIILANVGTPAECTKKAVKQFIGDMLSDPLVFGRPAWYSAFVAKNIIAPLSASRSLKKYKQVWRTDTSGSSPIVYYMKRLAAKLEAQQKLPVEIAFRYGESDVSKAIKLLQKRHPDLDEIIVFPLFPQYAQSTTLTLQQAINRIGDTSKKLPNVKFIPPYFNHPAYINALVENAKPYLTDNTHLVFVYHSLPIAHARIGQLKGNSFDYIYQLKETNRLFCETLGIPLHNITLFYSSQKGRRWLKPFVDKAVVDLPSKGWKEINVIAPGFAIDNMETLYDIDIELRKLFLEAGGRRFAFVPSLNDADVWVEAIGKIIAMSE